MPKRVKDFFGQLAWLAGAEGTPSEIRMTIVFIFVAKYLRQRSWVNVQNDG